MRYLPLPYPVFPIVTALTLIIVMGIAWTALHDPEALFAPGKLNQAHASSGCMQCHVPFEGPSAGKCIACHTGASFSVGSRDVHTLHITFVHERIGCLACHGEHRGRASSITDTVIVNPHSDFVFRVTGSTSCTNCHRFEAKRAQPVVLDNPAVRMLVAKGKGAHGLGRFADCLRCHTGGHLGREKGYGAGP
jgi:hypothetical protein